LNLIAKSQKCELESMTKVSVIVLSYNSKNRISDCIQALSLQKTSHRFEVIVVDNNSIDGSADLIATKFAKSVQLIRLKTNLGFAGGNAEGLKVAVGEYIVLLNDDTRVAPEWLEELTACALAHPMAGAIASQMLRWGSNTIDTLGDGCTIAGNGYKLRSGTQKFEGGSEQVFSACAGAVLYRRQAIEQVGFLEPNFFLNHEDTDLAFRMWHGGWQVITAPAAIVEHLVHASQGGGSPLSVYYASRNVELVWLRNMPLELMIWGLPDKITQSLFAGLYAILRGRFGPYIRGKLAVFPMIIWAWHSRKHILSNSRFDRTKYRMLQRVYSTAYFKQMWNRIRTGDRA
jgi:GT2 family glycosyltransferase